MVLHPEIPKHEYRQRAKAILEAVGLGDRVDYYPEKLSGGQKQRVATKERQRLVARHRIFHRSDGRLQQQFSSKTQ